ncbi:GNAT family N-acetyltransferase [Roseateles sp. BYS180W]|uniref:GNAT family N-acetyltransferase n=1 Tax=Roseateles rivi TaxID=3299028 RepID=A0ABW7FWR5_9BURK
MSVVVRLFEPADHAAAFALWRQTPGLRLGVADTHEAVMRYLLRNPGMSFVALHDKHLVGTVLCGHDGRHGQMHHLVVHPSQRRRGLARQLVRLAVAGLREQGIDKCQLLVPRENLKSRAYWLRSGADERSGLMVYTLSL